MITVSINEGREFEIAEGSHVFMREADVYKEWNELTPEEIQQLAEIEREAAALSGRIEGVLGKS